ncbi:MAG TPA: NapC/NirT family cytochrome c [Geminicoccaceae bacterium]
MPQAPEQNQAGGGGRRSWLDRARGAIRGYPLLFILLALGVAAIVAVPTTEAVDRYFSSDQFCAQTCHVMTATVAKEFEASPHWNTTTGVRPTCADCHVGEGLTMAMWDHVLGMHELYAFAVRGIRTPEAFEEERAEAANRVRMKMLGRNSDNCRTCHVMAAIQPERTRGQRQHAQALENGTTCIACHYNLVHKEVEPSEEFLQAIER